MKIRDIRQEDIKELVEIEKSCFKDAWTREHFVQEIINPFCKFIVLEINTEIAGYGGLWYIFNEGHITNIAVCEKFRGKGFGNLILKTIVEFSKDKEIEFLTLEVRKSNFVAISLYKKYGFKVAGIRKRYYKDLEDAFLMRIDLK